MLLQAAVYTRTHNKDGPGILLIVSLKSAECVAMQLPPNLGSWVETEWQANLASVLNHPVTGDRMRAYWDELTRFAASPEHLQSRNRPSVMHKLRKQAVANAAHFVSLATTQCVYCPPPPLPPLLTPPPQVHAAHPRGRATGALRGSHRRGAEVCHSRTCVSPADDPNHASLKR